jgi:MFS family permease
MHFNFRRQRRWSRMLARQIKKGDREFKPNKLAGSRWHVEMTLLLFLVVSFCGVVTLDILTLMALATGNMMVTFCDSESFYAVQKRQRRIPKFWLPGHVVTAQRSMRRVMRCSGGDAGACDDRGHCNDVGNPSILMMMMMMMMMLLLMMMMMMMVMMMMVMMMMVMMMMMLMMLMMLMMTMMTITMMMMFTMMMMTQVHNSLSEIRHFPSF